MDPSLTEIAQRIKNRDFEGLLAGEDEWYIKHDSQYADIDVICKHGSGGKTIHHLEAGNGTVKVHPHQKSLSDKLIEVLRDAGYRVEVIED